MALTDRGLRAFNTARDFLRDELWDAAPEPRTAAARALGVLRFAVMIGEGFIRDRLLLRASALAYFTSLALIPMIAVAISIVGAVGVRSGEFAGLIVEQIAAGSPEAQTQILKLIETANFGGLGSIGAAALFLTTVLGLSNVEKALNGIWGVKQQRSLARRFPDYLAVLVVSPLLLVTSLSLATTLQSQWLVQKLLSLPLFASAYALGLEQAPAVVLSIAFAFLYWILPNTKVRISSALLGGIVAGFVVLAAQRLYLDLNVGVARYNVLFGGFSAIPLLFVWIYLFWAVVLFGAEVAFAHQHLDLYRREVRGRPPGAAEREAIGLRGALEIARDFRDRGDGVTADALSERLSVPIRTMREILRALETVGIVSPRGALEREGTYQLGRPAEDIAVLDVISALRGRLEAVSGGADPRELVGRVMAEIEEGATRGAAGRTLGDLLALLPRLEDGGSEAVSQSGGVAG